MNCTGADAKVSAGLAEVAAKQASANAEAQRCVDDGKRRADCDHRRAAGSLGRREPLMRAARKVGAKLRHMAKRFRQRRRGGRGEGSRRRREADPKESRAEKERRLGQARRAVRSYLKRPRRRKQLDRYLKSVKRKYRLKKLTLDVSGQRATIRGKINPEFIDYADAQFVVVENADNDKQAQQEGLVTFFRSMSLAELQQVATQKRLTTKVNRHGSASSEMMLAESNYFDDNEEANVGKGYSVDLIERKQNRKRKRGWNYAVLVKIEALSSAKTDVLLDPKSARIHSDSVSGNEETFRRYGIDPQQVQQPVAPGETGVVMLKVESNRGTAVKGESGVTRQKVVNYSIRTNDPSGLLEGDPLAEFNKKIVRITVVGGGLPRQEINLG